MSEQTAEQLFRPHLRGPLTSETGRHAGRTVISSGVTEVAVATPLVEADTMILLSVEAAAVGSAFVAPIIVTSKEPGVGFVIGVAGTVALPQDRTVSWLLIRT